ncbi:MAG: LamG domain-containing protein [Planctomycetes bacterium]|nr:LamG domain-containing protein [Planctomycetota bacterium]
MFERIFTASVVVSISAMLIGSARADLVFYVPIENNSAEDIAGCMAPDPAALGVVDASFSNDTPDALGAGQSLVFSGPGQVVDFGNLPLLAGAESSTVSMWIKPLEISPDVDRRHYALSKDGVLEYGLRNGEITNRINNADHAESVGLVAALLDGWNHIASVFSAEGDAGSGTIQHYLNGEPFGDPILLNGNPAPGANEGGLEYVGNDNPLALGNRIGGDDKNFIGLIDDVAIWNVAFHDTNIELLADGFPPPEFYIHICVPEPTSGLLLVLGSFVLLPLMRRRRSRS